MATEPKPTSDLIREQLRRMRTAAGLTQEEYGRRANYAPSTVSAVELGTRSLEELYLTRADMVLGTGDLFVSLLRLAARDGEPIWFRPWLDAERTATQLRSFQPNLIPGLLQTEAYARAVIRGDVTLTDEQVETLVAARLARQAILDREQPPQFTAVIDEAALHRFTEEHAAMMVEQLTHLIDRARQPNVNVHVIPRQVGLHVGLEGPFVLAWSEEGGWVGFQDNQLGGTVAERTVEVETLLVRWESVRSVALPTWQSIQLIKDVMKPWTP